MIIRNIPQPLKRGISAGRRKPPTDLTGFINLSGLIIRSYSRKSPFGKQGSALANGGVK